MPGLNFIYVQLNRVMRARDLNIIYIAGPGHGGPAIVANTYLEGTYSEFYPDISRDSEGMKRLFKQFSFPGGIPSHVAPETPGSFHEGGELGYALSHAYGAAFDNPDLIVACVVGDGESETGPMAASWHSNKFLNPIHDGAVLPILHLNGYKIANPTIPARIGRDELESLFVGYGYKPLRRSHHSHKRGPDHSPPYFQTARRCSLIFSAMFFIYRYMRRWEERTESKIDDHVIGYMDNPVMPFCCSTPHCILSSVCFSEASKPFHLAI